MPGEVAIEVVTNVTNEHVEAFSRLIPQLSSSAVLPDQATLSAVANRPGTTLFVARLDGAIVGSLTLATFDTPTGTRAWIEDVVVDGSARGTGLGIALTEHALQLAREHNVRTIDLTSRPSREAANQLYLRCGFKRRETNVYRIDLGE